MRSDFKQRHRENFFQEVTALGGYIFCALAILFFAALNEYKVALRIIFGFALIYLISFIIRSFYYKDRPEKFKHSNFLEKLDAAAFPSLHAARSAFIFAQVSSYANSKSITIISAIAVLMVCYSRIRLKRHDIKDVTAGFILGIVIHFAFQLVS